MFYIANDQPVDRVGMLLCTWSTLLLRGDYDRICRVVSVRLTERRTSLGFCMRVFLESTKHLQQYLKADWGGIGATGIYSSSK